MALNSSATVLVAGILLTLAGATLYAGPGRQLFAVTLALDGILLLAWLAAATGVGGIVLVLIHRRSHGAPAGRPRSNALLTVVTATSLGLGLMSLGILALGLAGLLNRVVAFALLAFGIGAGIAALALLSRDSSQDQPHPSSISELRRWWFARAGWGWASLLIVPFASIALVGTMVPAGLLWSPDEPHGYDVVEYHLQSPREWYEAGRIVPLRHNVYSFFPMNVEMHYLLAMHLDRGPWEGMFLAQLMHFAMMSLSVLGACGFASQFAPNRANAVLAAVAIATVPWLAQLGAIAYNEGGFLLFSILSVGWALRATLESERRLLRFILAGAFAGFASGVKLTAVPEVLVAVPAVSLIVMLPTSRFRGIAIKKSDLLKPILFGVVGLLLFSPWLIRNLVWTGNPLFPEAMSLFGHGHFSAIQVERWQRAHQAPPAWSSSVARLGRFEHEIVAGWQFAYVLIPLAVVSLISQIKKPAAWFLGLMLLVLTGFWLGPTHLQGRFYLLAVPLAGMLIAMAPWRWWAPAALVLVIVSGSTTFVPRLHRQWMAKLYDGDNPQAWVATQALANPDLSWITFESLKSLPPGAPLLLVGDAKAFWYPIPMTRLYYRTVFDADTSKGRGLLEAWETADVPAGAWRLYDPMELVRFQRTYPPLPAVPSSVRKQLEPYLLPPK